jgi:hypothetical protein
MKSVFVTSNGFIVDVLSSKAKSTSLIFILDNNTFQVQTYGVGETLQSIIVNRKIIYCKRKTIADNLFLSNLI